MRRFLIAAVLAAAAAIGSAGQANAQGQGQWSSYPGYYYSSPGAFNAVLTAPSFNHYSGYNPYSYSYGAGYPTLLNPNYVVGNNRVLITPYNSPNYYAPRRYEYKPYPPR